MRILHDAIAPTLTTKQPFQLGYATTDIDQAIEACARVHNAPNFLVRPPMAFPMRTPEGDFTAEVQIAFAYCGDVQIELVKPISDPLGIYTRVLPGEGFGLVLHHLGFQLDGDLADWDAFRSQIIDDDLLFEGGAADHTRFLYLDTVAEIGHPMEYLWWGVERRKWLDEIPRN